MKSIRKDTVGKSFIRLRGKYGLTNKQISQRGNISSATLAKLTKPQSLTNRHHEQFVTINTVNHVGKGLGFDNDHLSSWIKSLKNIEHKKDKLEKRAKSESVPQPVLADSMSRIMKKKNLPLRLVVQRSGMSSSNFSRFRPDTRNHPKSVYPVTLKILGKGLGFSPKETKQWIYDMKHPYALLKKRLNFPINQVVFAKNFNKEFKGSNQDLQTVAQLSNLGASSLYRLKSLTAKGRPSSINAYLLYKIYRNCNHSHQQALQWIKALSKQTKEAAKGKKQARAKAVAHQQALAEKPSSLSEELKAIMSQRHLDLQQVIDKTGLNGQRLTDVYNGRYATMPVLSIIRLAQGLHVDPKPLMKYKATAKPAPQPKPVQSTAQPESNASEAQTENDQANKPASDSSKAPAMSSSVSEQPTSQAKVPSHSAEPQSKEAQPNINIAQIKQLLANGTKNQQPNFRPLVMRTAKDLNKLNDADVSIIDLIVQRFLQAHYRNNQ